MNIPYAFKRCNICGEWLVAYKGNFFRNKSKKYGLAGECKKCKTISDKKYYEANKEYYKKRNKQYYEINKEQILEQCKIYRNSHKEQISEYKKKYSKDKKAISDKKYYEANKEKIAKQNKQYYEINKERILERCKIYRNSPKGQVNRFNSFSKRRVKKYNLGNGISEEQWLEMMNYFNWECAYSNKYIGGSNNKTFRSIDHIIPISKGGLHEIWNVVPMDKGLNSSKNDKDMLQWYKEQTFFSEERLHKIYEWQEYAYKKWHDKEEII